MENKLRNIILSILIEKYAHFVEIVNGQDEQQILLRFRNIYSVEEFLQECYDNEIIIGPGELNRKIAEVIEDYSKPCNGNFRLFGRLKNEEFFIGEILCLNLKSRQHIEMMKIDNNRWWLTSCDFDIPINASVPFFIPNASIGTGASLIMGTYRIDVESVDVIVSTDKLRQLDRVMYPSYFRISIPNDLNIEEILIVPLFEAMRNCRSKLDFSVWNDIVQSAYKCGLDYKTIWYATEIIANQRNSIYKWN